MSSNKYLKGIIFIIVLLQPSLAFAVETPTTFKALINLFTGIITSLIPIVFGFALLVFMWGVAEFIRNSGNETKIEEGRKKMFYGIIGLFVIVSIWGLVAFLGNSIGIPTN